MTRYSATQAQRTRHLLNREALKRSHRRGDLIRTLSDTESDTSAPSPADPAEVIKNPATTPHS